MKKILVISNTTFSIKKFREHYLKKISLKNQVDVLTPGTIKDQKMFKNKYEKIRYHTFDYNSILNEFFILRKFMKKSYNLIIAYSFKYQFYIFLLNIFYNKKIINVIAGRGSLFLTKNYYIKKIRDSILFFFFKYSEYTIFINKIDKSFFKKKYKIKKKTFLIPTEGIELKKIKQSKQRKKNFIFFARIIKEKGILEFINLAKKIKKKFPDTNFFVAGTNDKKIVGQSLNFSKENYLDLVKKSKYIRYIGYQKTFKKILPKMDCLVSPSYAEGAGQSVMESILSGLYVIVYNNSGHNFILNNNKNFICNKNNIDELERLTTKYLNQNLSLSRKEINKVKSFMKNNISSNIVFNTLNKILKEIEGKEELVSICLATYNHEKYITQCLTSILNQNYNNIEILISDDCSRDETIQKINEFFLKYKHNYKIKLYRQKKNLGISKNYNFLYGKSKGKYLIFFGGDDIMIENKVKRQVETLQNNPNASFCYSNCKWFYGSSNLFFNHFNLINRVPHKLEEILSDYSIPSPTIMINKKYVKSKPFDEKLKYYGDFLQSVNLWMINKPIYIDECLVLYRRHFDSVTVKKIGNEERLTLINLLKNKFKKNKVFLKKINQYKYVYMYHAFLAKNKKKIDVIDRLLFFLNMIRSIRGTIRLIILIISKLNKKKIPA